MSRHTPGLMKFINPELCAGCPRRTPPGQVVAALVLGEDYKAAGCKGQQVAQNQTQQSESQSAIYSAFPLTRHGAVSARTVLQMSQAELCGREQNTMNDFAGESEL